MTVAVYMDHHVPRAITHGLRLRDVDVLTAYEDSRSIAEDPDLLTRATTLQRVLFTQDDDFLALASEWQQVARPFTGVVYAHQLKVAVGRCVSDLELIAKVSDPEDLANAVIYLPL